MSKLPLETRPLRLPPDVARVVERLLNPLSGKKLELAQAAVLTVYTSGRQMACEQWVLAYTEAIQAAIGGQQAAA